MLDEQRRVRTLTSLQLAAMDSVWALCFGVHWQNMWFHPGEPHLCAQRHVPWVASSQFRIPRREMHLAQLGPGIAAQ